MSTRVADGQTGSTSARREPLFPIENLADIDQLLFPTSNAYRRRVERPAVSGGGESSRPQRPAHQHRRQLACAAESLTLAWRASDDRDRDRRALGAAVLDSRSPARVRATDVRPAIGRTGISPAEPADQRQDVLAFTDGNRRLQIGPNFISVQDALGQLTDACSHDLKELVSYPFLLPQDFEEPDIFEILAPRVDLFRPDEPCNVVGGQNRKAEKHESPPAAPVAARCNSARGDTARHESIRGRLYGSGARPAAHARPGRTSMVGLP